ncbi:hypothetical protein [Maridesulfovibrio sp.]|uniref:hypothetical protein n=1 Tax=Maridesulfovibrio sp. TaxID=2795000 RepID=UPI002A18D6DA|nr:hypothetical protein [Maridesulfovibrio sp.]
MRVTFLKPFKITWIAICLVLTVVFVTTPHVANAGYLDPGSGSTAVQWIIASIAAITKFIDKVKNLILRAFRK